MNELRKKIGYNSQSESNNSVMYENCFESLNKFIKSGEKSNKYRKIKKINE